MGKVELALLLVIRAVLSDFSLRYQLHELALESNRMKNLLDPRSGGFLFKMVETLGDGMVISILLLTGKTMDTK